LDNLISRMMEVWLAFPALLLAILVVARLGPSLRSTIIALGIVGVPAYFRLTRGSTLTAKQAPYVQAAHAIGCTNRRIALRHILPATAPAVIVLATMRMGMLVLAGGGLSFIGLGAQPPLPEWGALLASGRDFLDSAPWLAFFPGFCITLTVVGFNLLGDGLRDLMDPRRDVKS
jgi:ABC-type dipeptide/oligopeptide/nickel transport system permease subunit